MIELDVLIIGGGSAGEDAASYSTKGSGSVGMVEKSLVGGACVFNACIPTKALVHAARTYKKMRDASFYGLPALDKSADYSQVKAFKDRIIEGIGTGRDERMSKRGVRVFKGTARFVSAYEVIVNDEHIRANKIIIATGSEAAVPPIPGLEDAGYITNVGALDLSRVPERLAIIGGGPVGVEFTQIFSAFGSQVTIYEMTDRVVSMEDEEISRSLGDLLSKQGVSIATSVKVSEIKRSGSGKLIVTEDRSGEKRTGEHDEILVATGRKPVMDELNPSAAGIETFKKGIKVDASLQTNVPHIWAAGDITGTLYFTYVGYEQGKTAALNATTGRRGEMNYDILPRATFCDPEIGSVGLTEAQAVEKGYRVKTGRYNYADMTRPIVSNETDGFIKIVAEVESGRILGGHILGAEASSLIHEVAAAMAGKMTVAEVGDILHSYPTFSEGVRYACQTID
ncbi:MAG: NAD(P)/FAD-dependent oxidoreductase [Dehalococcoidia bacterium]|nr:NAD(P)/FAD-dependent oxidoreductase [Dehalococcoidia bacterium]